MPNLRILAALTLAGALPAFAQLILQVRNDSHATWTLVPTATCPKGSLCLRADEQRQWGLKQPFQARQDEGLEVPGGHLLELEWEDEDSNLNGAVFTLLDHLGQNPLNTQLVAPSRQRDEKFDREPTVLVTPGTSRPLRDALREVVRVGGKGLVIRKDAYGELGAAPPAVELSPKAATAVTGKRKRGDEEPGGAPPALRPRLTVPAKPESKAAPETKAEPGAAKVLRIRNGSGRIWQWDATLMDQKVKVEHCDPAGELTEETWSGRHLAVTLLLGPGVTSLTPANPGADFCLEFRLTPLDSFGVPGKDTRFTWDFQTSPELKPGWHGQARPEKLSPELLMDGACGITLRSGEDVIRNWLRVLRVPAP